jgi:hypothetical protein
MRNDYKFLDSQLFNNKQGISENCDFETRKIIYQRMKQTVNSFISKDTDYSKNSLFLNLKDDGFTKLGKVLNEEQLNDIEKHFKNKQIYNQHVPPGDGIKRNLYDSTNRFNSYDPVDTITSPHLLELALSEKIIGTASEYLGCTPTLYSMNAFWALAKNINQDGGRSDVQKFHRDYDDFKFLCFFIYLVDVDEDTSPHIFVRNTHDSNKEINDKIIESNSIIVTGERGSGFLADTYGVHSGTFNMKKDRFVVWLRYGLHKNSPTQRQMPNPFDKSIIQNKNIDFNEKNKFITRYVINH